MYEITNISDVVPKSEVIIYKLSTKQKKMPVWMDLLLLTCKPNIIN